MIHHRTARFLAMLLAIAVLGTGCSWRAFWTTLGLAGAAGVGAAAVYYSKGDLEADFDEDIRDVYDASKATMQRRGYDIAEDRVNRDEGLITGRTDDDKRIRLSLNERSGNRTRMKIRIGTVGDEAASRNLYDDIREELRERRRRGQLRSPDDAFEPKTNDTTTGTAGNTNTVPAGAPVAPTPSPTPG